MIIVAAPNAQQQVARPVLGLLLAGALVALLPLFMRLFPGFAAFGVVAVAWGAMVQAGRWHAPHPIIKGAFVFAGAVIVLISTRHPFAIEPMVGLLMVAYQLKLMETTRRRDGFVVAFAAYFIIATHFLFDQSLLTGVYAVCAVVIATAGLVAQIQSVTVVRPREAVSQALRLVLPAVPLAAAVFLLFPRVSPLWTVPMPTLARTGLAETLRPQDVVALARSGEVAFRVNFLGTAPPPQQRYWRAVTYYDFVDESWQIGELDKLAPSELVDWPADRHHEPWHSAVVPDGEGFRYRVIMEPTGRQWLYALGKAASDRTEIGTTRDGRLMTRAPVVNKFAYSANSTDGVPGDLPQWLRAKALQLPAARNPRTRQLVAQLQRQSNRQDHPGADRKFVAAVLDFFRTRGFRYTLTPDAIRGNNSIDGFLFGTRRGFCAHFAGSLVFMARAAGIPARLVGGYLGGEQNSLADFVTVRQYDAHAWAELWLDGEGWVRVDPTAVVAPDRINRGVESLADATLGAFGTPWGVRRVFGLATALNALDSLEHQWNEWVVGYDAALQAQVLARWFGAGSWRSIGIALIAVVGALLASYATMLTALTWWRRLRAASPARELERWGARQGHPRQFDETLSMYGARLSVVLPHKASLINPVVAEANALLYAATASGPRALRAKVRQLRFGVGSRPLGETKSGRAA